MNLDDAPAVRGDFEIGVGKCGTVGEAGAVCGRGRGRGRFRRAVGLGVGMGTGTARKEASTWGS